MIPAQPGDTALDLLLRALPNLWLGLAVTMGAAVLILELFASWETRDWLDEAILGPAAVVWVLLFVPAMVALHFLTQRRIKRGAPPP